jgi:hypothetical protein
LNFAQGSEDPKDLILWRTEDRAAKPELRFDLTLSGTGRSLLHRPTEMVEPASCLPGAHSRFV